MGTSGRRSPLAVTMDLKEAAGNRLYLVGVTQERNGGVASDDRSRADRRPGAASRLQDCTEAVRRPLQGDSTQAPFEVATT